ncbi:TetR/AcrR family transcriptional regulator [Dermatophilus congolensis]|nr:TetR/AcrR family transcriptional regulator [Dermatophilus congolensis]MBO3130334.1 TetR/AcrR family transcriptional regulator [Dermatophilus congolensis]MBO3131035.1 TetR/AcrR family transcriptional regulator [Dermatophilus congolensis]MBO3134805.1 TetR/AcrR family transcriptional regulator [Dermatophilus congolensis]MBO3137042.1 TetR/AcrR family transcriptional regulator [Dermatophilus congolensis]MBO3139286.1 TetR/AcrR family transcriptional regulator [Dermatophilus congolensis]
MTGDKNESSVTKTRISKKSAATMSRRERARADKRARILSAAADRLRAQGFERTTVAQVAEDADVAVGTVFQYAATKAELLMMVAHEQWATLISENLARVEATTEENPELWDDVERMARLVVQPLVEFALEQPENSAAVARELLFGAEGPHRSSVVVLAAQVEAVIAEVLRRGGRPEGAEAAARLIVSGAVLELNRTRTGLADAGSVETRLATLIGVAVAGAAPR